uniref:Uncharacterized protein n=1 Tax=Pseudo-nitzschia delicatissima TaxID=44447 RepID=A0A7S0Y7U4_9STRA
MPAVENGQKTGCGYQYQPGDEKASYSYSSAASSVSSASSSATGAGASSSSFLLPKSGSQLGFSKPSSFKNPNWREVVLEGVLRGAKASDIPTTRAAKRANEVRMVVFVKQESQ